MEKFSIILLWRLNHDKSHYLNEPITRNTFEAVTKTHKKKDQTHRDLQGNSKNMTTMISTNPSQIYLKRPALLWYQN